MAKTKSNQQKQRFTREEIVAAVAGIYRAERAIYRHLAERTRDAAQRGNAAEYAVYDEEATKQEIAVKAVKRVAAALGIGAEELNLAAADDGEDVE